MNAEPSVPVNIRASDVIPGGASTGSKRADALYGIAFAASLPTHFRRAYGCLIETVDGRELVDCTMALGAVSFGYADPEVTQAVQEAAAAGPLCGLSPLLEIEVAEQLARAIPCAEQVRFLRSGAEATAAAVRIARTHTRRDVVISSGYFGWHDWSNPGAGVPLGAHADVVAVPFDNTDALEQAVHDAGERLAAIIVEPLVHHIASITWLSAARAHCDRVGAVLIYDEIKTAFRIRTGGVQEQLNVLPDLTCVGKALANGYPLAAVVGRRDVMRAAERTWISSTLASECTALAAAQVVLERHAREDVCAELARTGVRLQNAVLRALETHGLEVTVDGLPQMWRLESEDETTLSQLVAEAAREGVLLKRGAYQFAALAHDSSALERISLAVSRAAARVVSITPSRAASDTSAHAESSTSSHASSNLSHHTRSLPESA